MSRCHTVHSQKSVFTYGMEELPGYKGATGASNLQLDTDIAIVQPHGGTAQWSHL